MITSFLELWVELIDSVIQWTLDWPNMTLIFSNPTKKFQSCRAFQRVEGAYYIAVYSSTTKGDSISKSAWNLDINVLFPAKIWNFWLLFSRSFYNQNSFRQYPCIIEFRHNNFNIVSFKQNTYEFRRNFLAGNRLISRIQYS